MRSRRFPGRRKMHLQTCQILAPTRRREVRCEFCLRPLDQASDRKHEREKIWTLEAGPKCLKHRVSWGILERANLRADQFQKIHAQEKRVKEAALKRSQGSVKALSPGCLLHVPFRFIH